MRDYHSAKRDYHSAKSRLLLIGDQLIYQAPTAIKALATLEDSLLGTHSCDLRGLTLVTLGARNKGLGLELALNFCGAG